jgi:hypothetical protein
MWKIGTQETAETSQGSVVGGCVSKVIVDAEELRSHDPDLPRSSAHSPNVIV